MSNDIIQIDKELIHSELKDLVKDLVEETLNAMLDAKAQRNSFRNSHHRTQEIFITLLRCRIAGTV